MYWNKRSKYLEELKDCKNLFKNSNLQQDSCTDKLLLTQALNENVGVEKLNNVNKLLKVEKNVEDLPVIIVFQIFVEKFVKDNLIRGFDLRKLNDSELGFVFGRFFKNDSDFNYIFVKDKF
ncbi:hypothetical protein [Psychrobacter piscatorii]|uniref:hypothetical protein n=1 Tax=Psychrobacter piscatorii TaxID=554343 RepID=UPI00373632AD